MFQEGKGAAEDYKRTQVEEGLEDYHDQLEDESAFEDGNVDNFLDFLGERTTLSEEITNQYQEIQDPIIRLNFLSQESFANGIWLVMQYPSSPSARSYLQNRIRFYWRLHTGQATRKVKTWQYDANSGQRVESGTVDELIPVKVLTIETIKAGMRRDLMFAAMLGTPE